VKSPKPIRDWTIRQRIQASFLVIIAAMVIMGAFAYTQLDRVDGHAESMRDNTLPELSYSSQLLASWNQNYSISQELAIQQDSSQFDELSAEIQANRAKISDLLMKAGALANSEETGRLDALKQLVGDYHAVQEKILKAGEDMKALPLGPASSLQRTA
jgi:methyl-accepting chemotaxis protein WspA